MKRIKSAITAVRMLGVFGFILVSAVIIISMSIFNIFLIDEGIVEIHEHSQRLFLLENIEFDLLQEELAERNYILHANEESITEFEEAGESLDSHFEAYHELSEGHSGAVNEIEEDRETLKEDFEIIKGIVATVKEEVAAGGGSESEAEGDGEDEAHVEEDAAEDAALFAHLDLPYILALEHHEDMILVIDGIFREEERIDRKMEDLVFEAETEMAEDVHKVTIENQAGILRILVGLIIFPLLAVWAFLVASQLTQPFLSLTNAVVAIGGRRYRIELLDDVLTRRDSLGKLAKMIDRMADTANDRAAALQQEVDDLETQLRETHRRKLVMTSTTRRSEEG